LAELFEVIGAGALTSGVTALAYVLILDSSGGSLGKARLVDPTVTTNAYVHDHLSRVSLNVATVVGLACVLAWLLALAQRRIRTHKDDDHSRYEPENPLWVRSLGNRENLLTVEMKDGRQIIGYLGGHSVDDDGTPTIYLTPPLATLTPSAQRRCRGRHTDPVRDDYGKNAVTIAGTEIVAVWTSYDVE